MQTYNEYWVMIASQPVPVAAATPLATTVSDSPPATSVSDSPPATSVSDSPPATTVGDSPPATSVSDSPPASSGDGPAETTDSSIPLKRAATADIMVRLHGKG